ncbi:MAG: alpha/beta hydrolase [Bacteroidota bacterium]
MLRKKRFYLLLALVLLAGYVTYRVKPLLDLQMSDKELAAAFASGKYGKAQLGYLEGTTRKLRYLQIGKEASKPLLVFLHGSPASSAFWISMMRDSTLRAKANLLAIDRPGYGGSGLGKVMISVKEQAANVAAIIRAQRSAPNQKIILHGSSYGGTVSARIAMDFPELIDGLLLQSASLAPQEEYTYWITHPTSHWSLSWLMPSALHSANQEKLSHQNQLEQMVPKWQNIDAATVILHGTDDWLIYPPNAYFACDQLENAPQVVHHMVAGKQHDLIWTAPKLLKHYLYYLLEEVSVKNSK